MFYVYGQQRSLSLPNVVKFMGTGSGIPLLWTDTIIHTCSKLSLHDFSKIFLTGHPAALPDWDTTNLLTYSFSVETTGLQL